LGTCAQNARMRPPTIAPSVGTDNSFTMKRHLPACGLSANSRFVTAHHALDKVTPTIKRVGPLIEAPQPA
jgi:hypothetical protein